MTLIKAQKQLNDTNAIKERAYQIYQHTGCTNEMDNWVQAEQELKYDVAKLKRKRTKQ